jgi:hypothetical protein
MSADMNPLRSKDHGFEETILPGEGLTRGQRQFCNGRVIEAFSIASS